MKSSIKKRVQITGSGIYRGWKAGRRHKLTLKSLHGPGKRILFSANQRLIKKLIGA